MRIVHFQRVSHLAGLLWTVKSNVILCTKPGEGKAMPGSCTEGSDSGNNVFFVLYVDVIQLLTLSETTTSQGSLHILSTQHPALQAIHLSHPQSESTVCIVGP